MKSRKTWPTIDTLVVLLLIAATTAPAAEPLRVLILSGANNHDWKSTTPVLRQLLEDMSAFSCRGRARRPFPDHGRTTRRLRRDRQQLVGLSRDGRTSVG